MGKKVLYGADARKSVKEGIDAVANAVKSTLGPCGRGVIIDTGYEGPGVTKDGVTVAKSIDLSDKLMNAGAKFIRKIASKTADDAGDGTTTATVLAQAIVEEGSKRISTGVNPMSMKRGMDRAVKMAVEFYRQNSLEVDGLETLAKVATISANGDSEIGSMIADVINSVGKEGVVTVDKSKTVDTYTEKVNGLRFDKGVLSNYFITDPSKGTCELENPVILVTDQKITTIKSIQKVLEYVAPSQKPLLIISDGIEGEALTTLVVNKMRGTLRVGAAKCPAFGEKRKAELQDIATVTGATFITNDLGIELAKVTPEMLGSAEKVVCTQKNTTIVKGGGNQKDIDELIDSIRNEMESTDRESTKKDCLKRIARINGGVAVIYVGAISETELSEKQDRVDDALCATRAANEEGVLAGGGSAYVHAASYLESHVPNDLNDDEFIGFNILVHALYAPTEQIVTNALGEGFGKIVSTRIAQEDDPNFGYNAATREYCNLRESGVIDPTKVCRVATEYAASIAGTYLMTDCIIVDEDESKEDK